tara:strand:+ start:3900 stop:5276 length:1377 start_codon:yes stop_codon:yes gene_type:complete
LIYDIAIIGGGPGGYVAAIRAAKLGKRIILVESNELGGICLNWGCIPTKSLLKNAEILEFIQNSSKFGIDIDNYTINWNKIIKRSRDISKRLSKGIQYLMKKNKIEVISGKGAILNNTTIEVVTNGKKITLNTKNIIISTGAKIKKLPNIVLDGKSIISYKEALMLDKKPNSLTIIGAGAIGVEFAQFYSTFGTKVTLIEAMPNILPLEDKEISSELEKLFKNRNIEIFTNSIVKTIKKLKNSVKIKLSNGGVVESDKVLVCIGMVGRTDEIGLRKNKVELKDSFINVNEFMQTNIPNIYAIGDVSGPPLLAHVASFEGITAVEHIDGSNPEPMDYGNIPNCTYTKPEIASIGMTEETAQKKGYKLKIGKFPFRALGKSMAVSETDGFVKIIYDEKYGELLGCHIIGTDATNIITEVGIARKLETTHAEILKTVHPHPTLSEAIHEATADAFDESIHI